MKKDIKKQIMSKVEKGEIKKRSQTIFRLLKAATLATLITLGVVAAYSFNLTLYLPKRAGFAPPPPSPWERFLHALDVMPWPIFLVGGIALAGMVIVYRKYEGGYKAHLRNVIIAASIVALVSGYAVYASSINEKLDKRPGIRKFHDYSEQEFIPKGRRLKRLQKPEVRGKLHEKRMK